MNLKQIIQSQKTQKFDLTSLVRDTEETLHESSTGSSSGAAATSSTWATIKSLYEGVISEQSKIPALKNGQLRQNQAGERYFWYLNNKTGKPIASTDANADRQQYTIINPDDEEADKIPKNERPSQEDADTQGQETGDQPQDTDTATEPSQGTGTDDDQKSYDDELADLLSKDDDDKEGKSDEGKDVSFTPEATEEDIESAQENIENAGEPNTKDKTLGDVNDAVFSATEPPATSDEEFKQRMDASKSQSKKPPFEFTDEQKEKLFSKVPAVYSTVIERMLSQTQGRNPNITDFMQGVGAGQPSSQAGEIITMISITLSDDEAEEFFDLLEKRVEEHPIPPPKGQKPWIDKSWIQSARDVRAGTIARYNKRYGEGNWEVDRGCWDSQTEVEAMGLKDYTKNKGYSTDTYMRLKVDGKPVLDEISLKKDLNVNLLNKTTNALIDFAIMGSENAGEYTQLQKINAEIPPAERSGKASREPKYKVGDEMLSAADVKERIENMQRDAFSNLLESEEVRELIKDDPELESEIEKASGEGARKRQRELLSDAMAEDNMTAIRDAAAEIAELDPTDQWSPELEAIVAEIRGSQSGSTVKGWMKDYAEKINEKDENGEPKIKNITFEEDDKGRLVVKKNGVELKKPEQKREVFGTTPDGKPVDIQKLAMYATHMGASTGNTKLQERKKAIYDNIQGHTNAVISVINKVPSVREGMLLSIREEFPLKALFEGEEAMALSKFNCDPAVLGEIFKDENGDPIESYEQIQDKLEIAEDERGNLSLVYRASAGGDPISVAELDVRSDGKGYGNTFKFTLKVHKEFKQSLRDGNKAAYGDSGVYEVSINLGSLGSILAEDKQNTLAHHWKIAEDDYPVDLFIKELNERSLN